MGRIIKPKKDYNDTIIYSDIDIDINRLVSIRYGGIYKLKKIEQSITLINNNEFDKSLETYYVKELGVSLMEKIISYFIQYSLFENQVKVFSSYRPDWLNNYLYRGDNLELDIYFEYGNKKYAIEYSDWNYHNSAYSLEKDKIKRELCLQQGIKLFIIYAYNSIDKFYEFIGVPKCHFQNSKSLEDSINASNGYNYYSNVDKDVIYFRIIDSNSLHIDNGDNLVGFNTLCFVLRLISTFFGPKKSFNYLDGDMKKKVKKSILDEFKEKLSFDSCSNNLFWLKNKYLPQNNLNIPSRYVNFISGLLLVDNNIDKSYLTVASKDLKEIFELDVFSYDSVTLYNLIELDSFEFEYLKNLNYMEINIE